MNNFFADFTLKNKDFIIKHLESGVDVNSQDGNTALHIVCNKHPNFEIIQTLLSYGADPNIRNNHIPLHYACRSFSSEKVIEKLIEVKSDLLAINGNTPLHVAAFNHFMTDKIFQLLLSSGSNANLQNKETPLHIASQSQNEQQPVKVIISAINDINIRDNKTPLHFACLNKKCEIAFDLLEAGADPNALDGNTPIHFAIKFNQNPKLIVGLIQRGARINIPNFWTPFHFICNFKQDPQLIKYFLGIGANTTIETKKKATDFIQDEMISRGIELYNKFCEDFQNLFKSEILSDIEIKCCDYNFQVHNLILKERLTKFGYKSLFLESEKINQEEMNSFLEFIYTGQVLNDNEYFNCEKVFRKIGMFNFHNQIGKKNLLFTMKKLFLDENSKDIEFVDSKNQVICKAHKFILAARTKKYFDFFKEEKEKYQESFNIKNQFVEESQTDSEAFKAFVYFLYLDKFPKNFQNFTLIQDLMNLSGFYNLFQNEFFIIRVHSHFAKIKKNQKKKLRRIKKKQN
ncbi:ankyrin repeat-containing protein [Anaeramoeba ignava]|uniref:Ankyrin repeat-containing protein n=1 Tax=Anaeramoeba ignava TaxID=1746090 RepID=A0A9Q0LFW9_ANAIG|nr:ankyrin repeat-containing protein [Anaeramoeba ignava]